MTRQSRNEEIVDMFRNFSTQREIAKKYSLADSSVYEILHKLLTNGEIKEIKRTRIKMTAKKYTKLYLEKRKNI